MRPGRSAERWSTMIRPFNSWRSAHGAVLRSDRPGPIESLEARTLLAAVMWDGGGDGARWLDPLNWAADVLPGPDDDAVIPRGAGKVVLDGFAAVASLDARAGFVIAPGAMLNTPSVFIDAGAEQVRIEGRLEARRGDRGGGVEITGDSVILRGGVIDAGGPARGGRIALGGGARGIGDLPHARRLWADSSSIVDASGDTGGVVVVWSSEVTRFGGLVRAPGITGDGGHAEVSSKGVVDLSGKVDVTSAAGRAGSFLLDPRNIIIGVGGVGNPIENFDEFADAPTASVELNNNLIAAILASGANVTLEASNDITVSTTITVQSTTIGTLTLRAGRSIAVNFPIRFTTDGTSPAGHLVLEANAPGGVPGQRSSGLGGITISQTIVLTLGNVTARIVNPSNAGEITMLGGLVIAGAAIFESAGDIRLTPNLGGFACDLLAATAVREVRIGGTITGRSLIDFPGHARLVAVATLKGEQVSLTSRISGNFTLTIEAGDLALRQGTSIEIPSLTLNPAVGGVNAAVLGGAPGTDTPGALDLTADELTYFNDDVLFRVGGSNAYASVISHPFAFPAQLIITAADTLLLGSISTAGLLEVTGTLRIEPPAPVPEVSIAVSGPLGELDIRGAASSANVGLLRLRTATGLRPSSPLGFSGAPVAIENPEGANIFIGEGTAPAIDLRIARGLMAATTVPITIGGPQFTGVITLRNPGFAAPATIIGGGFVEVLATTAAYTAPLTVVGGTILITADGGPLRATGLGSFTFRGPGNTIILDADVSTAGQPIEFDDRVVLARTVTVSTDAGGAADGANVAFLRAVDSIAEVGHGLTVRAGALGGVTIAGPVGDSFSERPGFLTVAPGGGFTSVAASVRTIGDQTFGQRVRLDNQAGFISGGIVSFAGALEAGPWNALIRAAEIDFLGPVSGSATLALEADDPLRDIELAGAATGDQLNLTSQELERIEDGFAFVTYGGEDGAAELLIADDLLLLDDTELRMPMAGGKIRSPGILRGTPGTRILITGPGSTFETGGGIITHGGAIEIRDGVRLLAGAVLDTTNGGAAPAGATVFITGAVNSEPGVGGSLAVATGSAAATLSGEVGTADGGLLGFLSINAGAGLSLGGGIVRTTGEQTYNGPTTFANGTTFSSSGANVTFNGVVTGVPNVQVAPGTGIVTFNRPVGLLGTFTAAAGQRFVFNSTASFGTLTAAGGSITLNGAASADLIHVQPDGVVTGLGAVSAVLRATGGTVSGPGLLTLRPGTSEIAGGPFTLSKPVSIRGELRWTMGAWSLHSTLTITPGTLLNIGTASTMSGTGGIVNVGHITVRTLGTARINGPVITQHGVLEIIRGVLDYQAGGGTFTNSGSLVLWAGAQLSIDGHFAQSAVGSMTIRLSALSPATRPAVVATGSLALAGSLTIDATGVPDRILLSAQTLLHGASRSGVFGSVSLVGLSPKSPALLVAYTPRGLDLFGARVMRGPE